VSLMFGCHYNCPGAVKNMVWFDLDACACANSGGF